MSQLALSDSFEYLCYGSTSITKKVIFIVWESTVWEYRRQILTSEADSRAVRVKDLFL